MWWSKHELWPMILIDRVAAARIRGTGMQLSQGFKYIQSRSTLCFSRLMDRNALDYELAWCPVASSAPASRGIIRRTLEFQLPGLPALGLQPNSAEARANTDHINSSLSGTGKRVSMCVFVRACLLGKMKYWQKYQKLGFNVYFYSFQNIRYLCLD